MSANDHVWADLRVCPTKEAILSKTHYGLTIYSHILRLYYPDEISCKREQNSNSFEVMPSAADIARSEIVLRLVGRDCGLCRNPFNANKETLHIWIEKEKILGNAMDKEHIHHEDSENAIPAGDAFSFAELHYKQQGDELLQTLNKELFLRIGENFNFYKNRNMNVSVGAGFARPIQNPNNPINPSSDNRFSFFRAPITNTKPHKAVSLLQIYNAIKGEYYKSHTEKLRAIFDVGQARLFKAANFDYCTFSGIFSVRNDKALIQHSNMLCVDFDHLPNVELLRNQLLKDEYFDTLLLFRSPSGDGLKWIIPIDVTQATHANYFLSVANYLKATYKAETDKSGKDISRACFLPHDPQAYINPTFAVL